MNIKRAFNLAKKASEFSDCKIKMGAVIVSKNKVISVGWNTNKSNPKQKKYNILRKIPEREMNLDSMNNGLHCEHMALRNASKQFDGELSKCSIFIYSEKKDGTTRLSCPCKACKQLIKEYRLHNVYYVTENGYNFEKY